MWQRWVRSGVVNVQAAAGDFGYENAKATIFHGFLAVWRAAIAGVQTFNHETADCGNLIIAWRRRDHLGRRWRGCQQKG
jgi:hypothetical protein